ncbi:MAG TPA: hypothetical protein VF275_09350 [Gammaproteobacteria bacterium]
MKARFSYPLIFFLPSAMAAVIGSVFAGGVGAGILWLFVHGDNPWPETAETVVMALVVVVAAVILAALVSTAYAYGKRRESNGGVSGWHVALAMGLSVALPAIVLLHQWRIGNIG